MGKVAFVSAQYAAGAGGDAKLLVSANFTGEVTTSERQIERQLWHVKRVSVRIWNVTSSVDRQGVVPAICILPGPHLSVSSSENLLNLVRVAPSDLFGPAEARDFWTEYGIYVWLSNIEATDTIGLSVEYEVMA